MLGVSAVRTRIHARVAPEDRHKVADFPAADQIDSTGRISDYRSDGRLILRSPAWARDERGLPAMPSRATWGASRAEKDQPADELRSRTQSPSENTLARSQRLSPKVSSLVDGGRGATLSKEAAVTVAIARSVIVKFEGPDLHDVLAQALSPSHIAVTTPFDWPTHILLRPKLALSWAWHFHELATMHRIWRELDTAMTSLVLVDKRTPEVQLEWTESGGLP